ncbi:hypothetical protein D3C74_265120 [compost metagenome]
MGAALGGANRTEKAEDNVQSLHLAEKTLDEAVAYLVAQYDGEAMRPEDLAYDMLQSQVDKLKPKITNPCLNGAEGIIIKAEPRELAADHTHTSYSVKLTAEATVNNTKRTLQQEVIISSYPEFLNYAFGSEKDVIINGAVYSPKGSVYAGNELKIDNWADYKYFTIDKWIKAAYPRLDLKDDNKVFVQSLDAIKVHNLTGVTPRGREEGDYTSYLRSSNPVIDDLLGISQSQIQIRSNKKFVSINVEETFIDKATEATGIDTARSEIKNAIDSGNYTAFSDKLVSYGVTKMTTPPVKPTPPLDLNDTGAMSEYLSKKATYDSYIAQFSNISGSKLFDGDLELDGIEYKALEFTNNAQQGINGSSVKWFVVNGDLNIMNYNPDPGEKLTIKGNILVTGDVTISGNVMVDATIYTLGKTTLQDAIIRGMGPVNDRKQLMMISKGKIFINRVDAPSNHGSYSSSNANTLDAFFYTDDTAELYGVGSVFWLNGGFFSKGTLTINAVRGDVTDDPGVDFNFHSAQDGLDKDKSRFVIEYYDKFFDNQSSALPRVEQLSVQVKSRKLISNP